LPLALACGNNELKVLLPPFRHAMAWRKGGSFSSPQSNPSPKGLGYSSSKKRGVFHPHNQILFIMQKTD
jgi:hypothetical protein